MDSTYLNRLIDLAISPYALIGLVAIIIIVQNRSPKLFWLSFSLFCFAATLGKFQTSLLFEPPALIFPLQQLRDAGRPLTYALLGLLVLLVPKTTGDQLSRIPPAFKYLIVVQVAIVVKTLLFGSMGFALSTIIVQVLLWTVMIKGVTGLLQFNGNFQLAAQSVALTGVIFIVVNALQASINPYPITFLNNQFLGTTNNPQLAALVLVATIPAFLFLIEHESNWFPSKLFWISFICLTIVALFLTGSRTGAIVALVSILFFFRQKAGFMVRTGLILGVVFMFLYWGFGSSWAGLESTRLVALNRYLFPADTRTNVWNVLVDRFFAYPIFGEPIQNGRIGVGENSWLTAGATLGLVGLVPLLLFGLECLKLLISLVRLASQVPRYFFHCSLVISGLVSLLVGSFSEAFLLGNLTFPLFALLVYIALGDYLVNVVQRQEADDVIPLVSRRVWAKYSNPRFSPSPSRYSGQAEK